MGIRVVSYLLDGPSPFLLRDSTGSVLVSSSPSELLDFLLLSASAVVPQSALRVFWDLDASVSPLLSLLPEPIRQSLSTSHRASCGSHRLFYIPGKLFSVRRSGQEATFYDLSQYFPEDPEPASLEQLQAKATLLLSALAALGVPSPTTLASPVACATASLGALKAFGDGQTTVPTILDVPESCWEAFERALQCTPREWVCNYQVGHWGEGELWSYDISSAYPWHASQLLDLRDCSFSKSSVLDEGACYGVLRGRFTVYPDSSLAFCSPFLADRGDGTLVNFVGTVDDYPCTLDEVRILYRHGLGEFRLKSGWFITPLSGVRPRLPFGEVMPKLYRMRAQSSTASFFLKRVMNGLVGKLLEVRKDSDGGLREYGGLYNPIYHAIITARTRLQVFEFLVQRGVGVDDLAHVGVDGCKLSAYVALPSQAPMGKWRCAGADPTFILSPGAVVTSSRRYKGLDYGGLLSQALERPSAHLYGEDGGIDLSRLFLSQTRHFWRLPRTGLELVGGRFGSEPVLQPGS